MIVRLTYPLRANVSLRERRDRGAGLTGDAERPVPRVPRHDELELPRTAAAVVRAEVVDPDDLRLPVAYHQLAVADKQTTGVVAGDSDHEDFARRRVDAVTDAEVELIRRCGLRVAIIANTVFIANFTFVYVQLGEVLPFVQLQTTNVTQNVKGKSKGLDTCYSANCMSQTRDQQRFTISEVAADWHEPMVPQRFMWPSIARANRQLDPRCS